MLIKIFFINFTVFVASTHTLYAQSSIFVITLACFFSICFSLFVIKARHPIYALLSLIAAFISLSVAFLLLGAEFLPLMLIIVYAGAVAVLFLFVIMSFSSVAKSSETNSKRKFDNFDLALLSISAYLVWIFDSAFIETLSKKQLHYIMSEEFVIHFRNIEKLHIDDAVPISNILYEKYWYTFIVITFILLVAMCSSVLLALNLRDFNLNKNK